MASATTFIGGRAGMAADNLDVRDRRHAPQIWDRHPLSGARFSELRRAQSTTCQTGLQCAHEGTCELPIEKLAAEMRRAGDGAKKRILDFKCAPRPRTATSCALVDRLEGDPPICQRFEWEL